MTKVNRGEAVDDSKPIEFDGMVALKRKRTDVHDEVVKDLWRNASCRF